MEGVDADDGIEPLAGPRSRVPMRITSVREDPDTCDKKVSVAALLPTGAKPGQFSSRVVDGGMRLEAKVAWPRALTDPRVLHKKWL